VEVPPPRGRVLVRNLSAVKDRRGALHNETMDLAFAP
jgi:hypothetical protein